MAENLARPGEVAITSDSQVALDQHFARALSSKPSSPQRDRYTKPMEPFAGDPAHGSQGQRDPAHGNQGQRDPAHGSQGQRERHAKPMEPFAGDPAHGTQVQRYYHARNRVNVLKRRTPVFYSDSMPSLLPKRQRFCFPNPRGPSPQQYAIPHPNYYPTIPNNVMVPPMTPLSPNMMAPMGAMGPMGPMIPPMSPGNWPPLNPNGCIVPPQMGPMMPQVNPNSCMMTPPPFQPSGPGWYPNLPEHHPAPRMKNNNGGGYVYPEFSQFLFHPEVDSFKDIPRLPGETVGSEELVQDVFPHFNEQWGEPLPTTSTSDTTKDIFAHVSLMSPPSSQAAAVMDSLRMTDQELDGILELKGEI